MMRRNARILLPEAKQSEKQTGRHDTIKRPTPSPMRTDHPADHIAERAANGNCGAKDRHDQAASFDWIKIGQNCRRSWTVAAFADADTDSGRKKNCKCTGQTGASACQTPKNHGRTDDDPTRKPIGQKPEDWRGE